MYRLQDGIEFLKSLPDESVDGIFTDPPWGVRISAASIGHRTPDKMIRGQSNWLELLRAMTDEGARVLKPDGRCLIWLGTRHVGPAIKAIEALEYKWMFFVRYIPSRYLGSIEGRFDTIIYYSRFGAPWPGKIKGRLKRQEFIKTSTGIKDTSHPCSRPLKTVRAILSEWFTPGEYV